MTLDSYLFNLEKKVNSNIFDFDEDIQLFENLLPFYDLTRFNRGKIQNLSISIWNLTVKLKDKSEKSTNILNYIAHFRKFSIELFEKLEPLKDFKYLEDYFYLITNTYSSYLEIDNFELSQYYFDLCKKILYQFNNEIKNAENIVMFLIYHSEYLLKQEKIIESLNFFKDIFNCIEIVSSTLISYLYTISYNNKSIEWALFCEKVNNISGKTPEWSQKIHHLLIQLFLNQNRHSEAYEFIFSLPNSIEKDFFIIKYMIYTSEFNESLFKKIDDFILNSNNDFQIQLSLVKILSNFSFELKDNIFLIIDKILNKCNQSTDIIEIITYGIISSIKINNLSVSEQYLNRLLISNFNDINEITILFWNKSIESYNKKDYFISIQWMNLSKKTILKKDFENHSLCLRFISKCYFQLENFKESLIYAHEAFNLDELNENSCFLLIKMLLYNSKIVEAENLTNNLFLKKDYNEIFSVNILLGISYEFFQFSRYQFSLDSILFCIKNKRNFEDNILSIIIHSIFALLQHFPDNNLIYETLTILNDNLPDILNLTNFEEEDILVFYSISIDCGNYFYELNQYFESINIYKLGMKLFNFHVQYFFEFSFKLILSYLKIQDYNESENIFLKLVSSKNYLNNDQIQLLEILTYYFKDDSIFLKIKEIKSLKVLFNLIIYLNEFNFPLNSYLIFLNHLLILYEESELYYKIIGLIIDNNKININEKRNIYDEFLNFLEKNQIKSIYINDFLSYSWNITIYLVNSLQFKEAELWFKISERIIEFDENLILNYKNKLKKNYKFLLKLKNRIPEI